VALDYTNSYGVHPWWPIDNRWLYGDAVFIVEPWFWIVALPPLFFIARGAFARGVFGLLLLAILGAAWRVEMVGREVAIVLTLGALLWALIIRAVPPSRRVVTGLGAWLGLEAMFFLGAASGRQAVERAAGTTVRDVVLSPFPGNPFCLSALVVTVDGGRYAVMGATVAPLPALRSAAACGPSMRSVRNGNRVHRAHSPAIQWGGSWNGPLDDLRALAASNCEVSAGLRFMRVPGWRRLENGDVLLFDLRYGEEGFASIVAHPGASCPGPVPPWEWPRSDVLGEAP
jgi:inner membrane protein